MAEPSIQPGPAPENPDKSGDHDLSAAELRQHAQEIAALYPPPRLGTELVLLEVSPHRAHAYWNIDVEDFQAAVARTGEDAPAMLLRVHDVTGLEFDGANSHSYFDVQVQGLQGHWYIDLWKDGRAYLAELGLRRAAGAFLPIARSNPVMTPRATESDDYHTRAVDTAQPGQRELYLGRASTDPDLHDATIDVETGAPLEVDAPPVHPVPPVPDAEFYPAGKPAEVPVHSAQIVPDQFSPNEFPIAPFNAVSTEDTPDVVATIFEQAAHPRVTPVPPPAPVAPATNDAARREEAYAHWPTAEELARHVPDTSGEAPAAIPAANTVAPAEETTASEPTLPPAEPAPQAAGPDRVPLENYVKLTSYAEQRSQVALEVNVELHIYGRAKPGTQLSLYGSPVPLQPDGSFSIRKPLPHGAVVLPLLAVDPPPQG